MAQIPAKSGHLATIFLKQSSAIVALNIIP
jgi:hypothetical protein